MKTGIFSKLSGQSFRRTLFRTVCILSTLVALTAWSVSGVYAKYVDVASMNGNAGVAYMGVKEFRLLEHKADPIVDDNLQDMLDVDRLYKLDLTKTVLNNTYSKVIPGVDIPKDPFIELELQSNEVSYVLYLKVEESGFPTENLQEKDYRAIDYKLREYWVKADGKENEKAGMYKYVGTSQGVENGFFKAGTSCSFTGDDVIKILKDDVIKVSQYIETDGEDIAIAFNVEPFSLTFTACLEQVLAPA